MSAQRCGPQVLYCCGPRYSRYSRYSTVGKQTVSDFATNPYTLVHITASNSGVTQVCHAPQSAKHKICESFLTRHSTRCCKSKVMKINTNMVHSFQLVEPGKESCRASHSMKIMATWCKGATCTAWGLSYKRVLTWCVTAHFQLFHRGVPLHNRQTGPQYSTVITTIQPLQLQSSQVSSTKVPGHLSPIICWDLDRVNRVVW